MTGPAAACCILAAAFATEQCRLSRPELRWLAAGRQVRCHTPLDEQGDLGYE